MTNDDIIAQITPIFRDIFEDDALEVKPEMTASDVEDWDSLSHIRLIVATEKHFGLRFSQMEIEKLENVGGFVNLIASKSQA